MKRAKSKKSADSKGNCGLAIGMEAKAPAESTPSALDTLPRARAKRRIDGNDIAAIARLCARQLTESEACLRIGLKPRTWFDWKSRNQRAEKFSELLESFKAHRIDHLIARLEKSADGVDLKFPDWRSALALLKIQDQRRFSETPSPQPTASANTLVIVHDALRRAYLDRPVIDVSTRALPEPSRIPPRRT